MQTMKQLAAKVLNKEFITQAIKFGLVGVLNTVIGFSVFMLCLKVLHLDYRLANVLSYIVGLINSFFFNKKWTFASQNGTLHEILPFLIVFAAAFGAQYAVTVACKELLHLNAIAAYIIGNVVYTGLGFLGNKFITFRKKS